MANMDLKTGNKLEGQRPGPVVSMPMGEAGSGLCDGALGWFSWTAISLPSLVCVSKRGRAEGGTTSRLFWNS